ncbi:hypothetical protein ACFLXE_00260 [Chloroflexota bacterium]
MTEITPPQLFQNPFALNRAEQMGNALHEYFVSDGLEDLLSNKPLVLEGGRGCGKTMFFRYHSYWSKKCEFVDRGLNLADFLVQESFIGIYYRADSSFVTAFQHKDIPIEEWSNIFAHYMNLHLSAEILDVVIDLKNTGFALENEKRICDKVRAYLPNMNNRADTIEEVQKTLYENKAATVMYLNNVGRIDRPLLIPSGVLVFELVGSLCAEAYFKDKVFQIFMDEFENLMDYQQVLLNSLVKGSMPPLIYNIGVRKRGHRRRETLASSEVIGDPHDFRLFDLEAYIGGHYETLLQKVCHKRFKQHPDLKDRQCDDEWLNIESYLGHYDIDYEFDQLYRSFPRFQFLEKLEERILELVPEQDKAQHAVMLLADPKKPTLSRLNLSLLERRHPPTVDHLLAEYEKYNSKLPSKYHDWLHNNKMGLLFLMCNELGGRKKYYGFEVYIALSSGIIRYFLELCEHAFRNAAQNGFSFAEPRQLAAEELDTAAHHVSRYKFNDIETYPPYGPQMKRFVLLLGGILRALHKDRRVSEPERNHFFTRMDEVSSDAKLMLDSAVMWSVLQEKPPTKSKQPVLSYEEVDYHLNRIYAPLFQISHRQKKKVFIPANTLNTMLEKPLRIGREAAKQLLERHKLTDIDLDQSQLELWSKNRDV